MERKTLKRTAIAAVLALAFAGAYAKVGVLPTMNVSDAPPTAAAPATAAVAPITAPASRALPDFADLVAHNGPAVVNITVSGMRRTADTDPFSQMDPSDPFYDFLRRFRPQAPRGGVPIRGAGSGFIVRSDGVILTNAHVVDGADEVTVKLNDRREFKAKVLGVDKATDVAVIKIDARDLPVVSVGDPSRTRVGEWVVAIGSPFGFENSVTAGIVSAKSRTLPDEGYVPFLQTDVAVNPGNSGGPLFNLDGQVIGINSQIYSRTGGYQGLSFAIPIDVAMKVEQQLVQNGKVERGRLGITIQDVNQSLADSFGLKRPAGALVSAVEPGSPGAAAGLEPGDVILKVDGQAIASSNELPPRIAELRPGTKIQLEVWRKGASRDLTATVGSQRADKTAAATSPADQGRLGLAVRPLSPDEKRESGTRDGLLVEDVAGPAARAGLRPGDIILALNGEPIRSVDQLKSRIAAAGHHVALLIQRDDARIFVPIDLG